MGNEKAFKTCNLTNKNVNNYENRISRHGDYRVYDRFWVIRKSFEKELVEDFRSYTSFI